MIREFQEDLLSTMNQMLGVPDYKLTATYSGYNYDYFSKEKGLHNFLTTDGRDTPLLSADMDYGNVADFVCRMVSDAQIVKHGISLYRDNQPITVQNYRTFVW